MTGTTAILGIPVPSTDPVFLSVVVIHIWFGLGAVVAGLVAMMSRKGRGRHARWGKIYFWCLAALSVTMTALSAARWAENYPLFILGLIALATAYSGRRLRHHPRQHLTAMGASYILLLTAFYVDNGKALPLWRELPQFAFWIIPTAVGVPLIIWAWFRYPLTVGHTDV